MDTSRLLKAVVAHKILAVVLLLLTIVTAMLLYFLAPRKYTAEINLYISAQGALDSASAAYQGSLLSQQRTASYAELLVGDRVLQQAGSQLSPTMSPQELRSETSVTAEANTVVLGVSVTNTDPIYAATAANAISSSFIALVDELERPIDSGRPPTVVVRAVEPAPVPTEPTAPRLLNYLAFGLVGGLVLALAGAFSRDVLDNTYKDLQEVASDIAVNPLSTVPEQDTETKDLAVLVRPESAQAEAFRALRTTLPYLKPGDAGRASLIVTSSVAGEGKSTVTGNLGLALASVGYSVLIVETDLRRPMLASYLDLDSSVGLTSVLTHRSSLSEVTQRYKNSGLAVLTSGPLPPNPSDLLASPQMKVFIEEVSAMYHYVLYDMPPVMPVSDAAQMSAWTDGVLLVVRSGLTSKNNVRESVRRLEAASGRVLGVILNRSKGRSSTYTSYYSASAGAEALVNEPQRADRPADTDVIKPSPFRR